MLEALAASTVKIEGRDVLATWKVLISLGLTPVVYSVYAILATLVMMRAQAPSPWVFWTPIYTLAALPWIAFAALKFGEAGMDVLKYEILCLQGILRTDLDLRRSLRPLVVALASGQQRYLDRVRDMRVKLSNELSEVIEEYAPKIYADYDKVSAETYRSLEGTQPFTEPDTATVRQSSAVIWTGRGPSTAKSRRRSGKATKSPHGTLRSY